MLALVTLAGGGVLWLAWLFIGILYAGKGIHRAEQAVLGVTGTTGLAYLFGGVMVYREGKATGSARYDERLKMVMGGARIEMELVVGHGPGHGWMMGCDLSRDYVRINADYTT